MNNVVSFVVTFSYRLNVTFRKCLKIGEIIMYRFYVDTDSIEDNRIVITGSDVNHIKNVLRLNKGEKIVICDGHGQDYYCIIDSVAKEQVIAVIEDKQKANTELRTKIYLFQGLPKKDKMELIVQKAVELGAYEVIPVKMKRTIVKIDSEKKEIAKLNRWQTIANEASKQSRRGIIPKVHRLVSYKEALDMAKDLEYVILPYELAQNMEYTRKIIAEASKCSSIGVFIGPEGGFDEEEVEMAKNMGFQPITLGNRILRTETAGLTTLSMLMYNIES